MDPAGHGVVTLRCGAKDPQANGSQRVLVGGTCRRRASAEADQGNRKELTLTTNYGECENLATLLRGWLCSPILEVGRLRLAEVMPFVLRASKRRSHSLNPGLPSSQGFFYVTHEERMGYRARICQTKNLSTRNDKYQCGYEGNVTERFSVG